MVAECAAAGARAVAFRVTSPSRPRSSGCSTERSNVLGPIDVFVNNAGILHRAARLDEMDLGRLQEVVAVNVVGAMVAAREAVRRMSTRHGGSGGAIVNVSSAAAYLGQSRTSSSTTPPRRERSTR